MNLRRIVYVGDIEACDFISALPRKLTLNDLSNTDFYKQSRTTSQTIFKEVTVKSFELSKDQKAILQVKSKFHSVDQIYNKLKEGVVNQWDSSGQKVILHSSGYDSRVLSKIIKELGLVDNNILFLECMGERRVFKEIADITKIPHLIHNRDKEPNSIFEGFFEFKEFWQKFNGVVSYPINVWFDVFKILVNRGTINSDFQGVSGFGSDEIYRFMNESNITKYFSWFYQNQLNLFNLYGDNWIHPYWDKQIIGRFHNSKSIIDHHKKMKIQMATKYVPELKHIKPVKSNELLKYRVLSKRIMKQITGDYDNSWYGKKFKIKPVNIVDYHEWWGHYCAASLCEFLLESGYEIT